MRARRHARPSHIGAQAGRVLTLSDALRAATALRLEARLIAADLLALLTTAPGQVGRKPERSARSRSPGKPRRHSRSR